MPDCNCRIIFRALAFIVLMMLAGGADACELVLDEQQIELPVIAKCKTDLAKRLDLQSEDINLIQTQPVNWPDTALGMPEAGRMYAQVITPGLRVILETRNTRYLYVTGKEVFKYGGPASIWSYSMLYLRPVAGEANLNGDLYQCSLMGTNDSLLISGVTDFYPQEKGVVIAKRRTSRSFHDLLYVKADLDAKTIYTAFDFGDVALSSAQDEWAGYMRPMIGAEWSIVIAGMDQDSKKTLPLPDGVKPGKIRWSGESLIILVKKGDRMTCFEISPKSDKPEWKEVGIYNFPGLPPYLLSRSETLEINQIMEDGKPAVEVVSVWFSGDRNEIAKISDFTLRDSDLSFGRYVFVWGEKDSKQAAYTIDIITGEIVFSFNGSSQGIKPFLYPPKSNPLSTQAAK